MAEAQEGEGGEGTLSLGSESQFWKKREPDLMRVGRMHTKLACSSFSQGGLVVLGFLDSLGI